MMDFLKHESSDTYKLMKKKFVDVFQKLETNDNAKNINKEFEVFCREVIVIRFNFAFYNNCWTRLIL